jgi:hypothetical protein
MCGRQRIVYSVHPVMPGPVPGIHVFAAVLESQTWMAGTGPAMTKMKRTMR